MKRREVLALAFAALAACAASPAWAAAPAMKAGTFEPPQAAPELALQGSDGAPLQLARFRGKAVALLFGFTHCAEVCPTTLATLAQARKALGAQGASVQVVFVTVDPERDDAARLRSYLAAFDPGFVGATGSPEAMAAARKAYGVNATKVPLANGDYAMDHTSSVYLVDAQGRLRAMMPYGHPPQDFVHDLRSLLAAR